MLKFFKDLFTSNPCEQTKYFLEQEYKEKVKALRKEEKDIKNLKNKLAAKTETVIALKQEVYKHELNYGHRIFEV